jgi:UDP-glucose 4-epimerase
MKTLVTGGAGFIGSNLVKLLLEKGHDVTVLDNFSSGYQTNLPDSQHVRIVTGDVRDSAAVESAINEAEVVFHLAASVGNKRSIDRPIEDSQINVLGTLTVLEAARSANIRKIVYSSSAGIFGELKTLPIREEHPVEPDTPYGASKLAGEKLCLAYAKLYDIEAVALRYFNVYGINQRYDAYGNVIPIFAHRIFHNQPIVIFGDGEQTRDFINVRDVVMANYKAGMNRGVSGAFNLGSGARITINHLAKMMVDIAGTDTEIVHGAPRPGDVRHSLADISAAADAFSFTPTIPLEDGLVNYLEWSRQETLR